MRLSFLTLLLAAISLYGEPVTEPKPEIEKINETTFRIGQVIFDQTTREIRIPVEVAVKQEVLEYLLTHINGKIHETLFTTQAKATNINIALKLLRYQESPELFQTRDEDLLPTGNYPDVSEDVKAAARLAIHISWKDGEKAVKHTANDLIINHETKLAMPVGPWLYSGSYIHEGRFASDLYGDYFAIFAREDSMINWPGEGYKRDDIWGQFTKRLPAAGTQATLIISPPPTIISSP